jgi:hypothetical protein
MPRTKWCDGPCGRELAEEAFPTVHGYRRRLCRACWRISRRDRQRMKYRRSAAERERRNSDSRRYYADHRQGLAAASLARYRAARRAAA